MRKPRGTLTTIVIETGPKSTRRTIHSRLDSRRVWPRLEAAGWELDRVSVNYAKYWRLRPFMPYETLTMTYR